MEELNKTDPHKANIQLGFTRNMGNFESLRIDVGLIVTARPGETASDLVDRVYEFTEKKLFSKFTETEKALSDQGLGQER